MNEAQQVGWATDMSTKATKHSAPGPYLGYGLQTVRLCARLLNEPPDSTVFVEHDDDVSVLYSDGTKLLEQTKRVKSNPLSDWSVDLWKTVHNWLEDHAPFDVVSKLCLYITPDHEPGEFAGVSKGKQRARCCRIGHAHQEPAHLGEKKSKVYPFVSRFLSAEPDEQLAGGSLWRLFAREIHFPPSACAMKPQCPHFCLNESSRSHWGGQGEI